jgi:RNA polymerase sigma-70 factor (ECF subfamily)
VVIVNCLRIDAFTLMSAVATKDGQETREAFCCTSAGLALDFLAMDGPPGDVTLLLREIRGDRQASSAELFSLINEDLHRLAACFMRKERPDHTLQTTALVNEAYLRLFQGQPFQWENRKQLFGAMAHIMRNLLVDHARKHRAQKHGGMNRKLSLDENLIATEAHADEILILNEALEELGRLNPRQVEVIELRYFAGLTVEETAAALDVAPETVKLDWRYARVWLAERLAP